VKRHIRELQAEGHRVPIYFRFRVVGDAGVGFQMKLDLDLATTPDDYRIETEGIVLVVDRKAALVGCGSVIDYDATSAQKGFSIRNPNIKPTGARKEKESGSAPK
jgi:iron-sulfur cluster assembly accessory protein